MRAALLLLALLGCFDWDAAGRCYGDHAGACAIAADGGRRDAAADGPMSPATRCTQRGGLLCDPFEGTWSGDWSTDRAPASSIIEIDASRPYRGGAAAHFHTDAVAMRGRALATLLEERTEKPTAPAELWLRAFVLLSSPASPPTVTLLSRAQAQAPFHAVTLGLQAGRLTLSSELAPSRTTSATDLPTGRWVCLELAIVGGVPGELRVRLDGTEVSDLHRTEATQATPPFGDVEVGLTIAADAGAQPALDLWVDELLIDTRETHCED